MDFNDIYGNAVKRKCDMPTVLEMTGISEQVEEIMLLIKTESKKTKEDLIPDEHSNDESGPSETKSKDIEADDVSAFVTDEQFFPGTDAIINTDDVEDDVINKIDYYKRYARIAFCPETKLPGMMW